MSRESIGNLLNMDIVLPYNGLPTYVISRKDWGTKENVTFITDNVIAAVETLRRESGKDIWLLGGGWTVSALLQAGLIDEMRIFHIPVILGKGIALFPGQPAQSVWKVTENKIHGNGVMGMVYSKN